MDLAAFLDKAQEDLRKAGKDPRSAYIDFVELCSNDETLKSKIKLDILLRYPLWRYRVGKEYDPIVVLAEGNNDKLKELSQKLIRYDQYNNTFYVFPHLPETDGTLTVKDNEDLKYLVERGQDGNGLARLADIVKYALSNGVNISVIDLSGVALSNKAKFDFRYFAGLPVSLRGEELKTMGSKVTSLPGTRDLSHYTDTLLVAREDGTFKVRYEPARFYEALDQIDIFMKNLKTALEDGTDAFDEDLRGAIESLKKEDLYRKPVMKDDGTIKESDKDFLLKTNERDLYDLVHGTGMSEDFRGQWSEFAGKLKNFDPKDYKSFIVFFLCWNGSGRVDFSTFSKDNFKNWQEGLNITYGRVLKNNKVQDTWNKCLDEVTDIPNKDEIRAMFGNLKTLFEADRYICNLGITEEDKIKGFLKSINDWEKWNASRSLYVTGQKHNSVSLYSNEVACYTRDHWKNYQKWRFEQYFLEGKNLPDSKKKPIKACEQGYETWSSLCRWESL